LEEELDIQRASHAAYDGGQRAVGEAKTGRPFAPGLVVASHRWRSLFHLRLVVRQPAVVDDEPRSGGFAYRLVGVVGRVDADVLLASRDRRRDARAIQAADVAHNRRELARTSRR
jgi:hypothetical protein